MDPQEAAGRLAWDYRLPVLPIVHTALARMQGIPLGRYFTDAATMAAVTVEGWRQFGPDGVQLTMGVAGEAEALGAGVDQPADGAPLVKVHPLADLASLPRVRELDPAGGRMPLYHQAVTRVVEQIGEQAFVVSTLRGPLNIASQLRGVEEMLIDLAANPEQADVVLEYALEVAIRCSRASLETGAHGIIFGEATCSPNFISPTMYRRFVQQRHARLVAELRQMGWRYIGLHVCGNILPILEDLIATGVDWLDVDYQVPTARAVELAAGRVALRGNLDPVSVLFRGTAELVRARTRELLSQAGDSRWIVSTGCDIPPGTPAANLAALAREAAG